MKVIVIGGGPAGMMAAITAAKNGDDVILLEKNKELGKKLLITGKGRCNITSSLDMEDFIKNTPGNGKFLYSAFHNFSNQDIIELMKNNGLAVKKERGNRIFPVTDRAEDVRNVFLKELMRNKVEIRTNCTVHHILVERNTVIGVEIGTQKRFMCDKVILATGGRSYPLTGSTGDGYVLAKNLGHTIEKIQGSIVPLKSDDRICRELQGLSLRNVKIEVKDVEKQKKIYEDFGEMLFTHFGVSGPTILSSSAHILRYKDITRLLVEQKIKLFIDMKPALSIEELDVRVRRDFEEFANKNFKNSLDRLLPKKMIPVMIELSRIHPEKKVNEMTREERMRLVYIMKHIEITITGLRPVEEAIITAGGISIKEIHPKTMESKLVRGLFFAGEIIDVDAYTGGFNLQIAYSTGYTAGISK